MKQVLQYFDQHLPMRVLTAIVFSAIFAFAPRGLADFYFRYVDSTQYVTLTKPSTDRKFYKPCDTTILTTSLSSKVDLSVQVLNQLVLVRSDGAEYRIPNGFVRVETVFPKADSHTVSGPYPLPCDIEDGLYFWRGVLSFKYHDVEKAASFSSDTFNVNKTGLSPETMDYIKEATESATDKK